MDQYRQYIDFSPSLLTTASNKMETGSDSPSCQVENCAADMSHARPYHRRHKICEIHARAPVVPIAGLQQRFCQQCGRFHEASEFDEGRRSCRSSLVRHTVNRRKSSAVLYHGEGSN